MARDFRLTAVARAKRDGALGTGGTSGAVPNPEGAKKHKSGLQSKAGRRPAGARMRTDLKA